MDAKCREIINITNESEYNEAKNWVEVLTEKGEPTHPSEILRDAMEKRGETQKGLAEKLGISKSYLNELINGKKDINANISVKLEEVWGIPAEFWLKFQMKYNISKAREKQKNAREKATPTRKRINAKATA